MSYLLIIARPFGTYTLAFFPHSTGINEETLMRRWFMHFRLLTHAMLRITRKNQIEIGTGNENIAKGRYNLWTFAQLYFNGLQFYQERIEHTGLSSLFFICVIMRYGHYILVARETLIQLLHASKQDRQGAVNNEDGTKRTIHWKRISCVAQS